MIRESECNCGCHTSNLVKHCKPCCYPDEYVDQHPELDWKPEEKY